MELAEESQMVFYVVVPRDRNPPATGAAETLRFRMLRLLGESSRVFELLENFIGSNCRGF